MICFLENTFQLKLHKNDKDEYAIIVTDEGIFSEADLEKQPSTYVKFILNEYDELTIDWFVDNVNRFTVKSLQVHQMVLINDEDECSIQFVIERWQSRMFKIEWKPSLHIEFGLYYEVCDDCD
ncbi:DUF3979 family protein [Gottfriedia solisilvae]|uniref:DUF3979 domain-containing protein n=1 Tax=Gottfriedia solisilvae TaxID=1516104 RepID=A0A8J3AEF9_9BACI|nr:DUF3979 family protein [Gottfriedia solisilvae]GGI12389.1 hypothetical protein GCM10007380_12670 [Gottfriedia solisilvae]